MQPRCLQIDYPDLRFSPRDAIDPPRPPFTMSLSEDLQSKKSDPDTSSIEKGEQNDIVTLANQRALDISLALPGVAGVHSDNEIDPVDSLRVKRKLDRYILPILCLLYTCMS